MKSDYIPRQLRGAKSDVEEKVDLDNKQQAQQQFKVAKERLLDISRWAKIAKGPSSTFCLTDSSGNEINRLAIKGDHIKINLPGPGSWIGGGNDWVRIESINHYTDTILDEEATVMTVKPSPNPCTNRPEIAHFFKDTATSTFLVKRHRCTLNAGVHGRNELPNTQTKLIDRLRNRLIALSAMAGLSSPQWKHLAKGLINSDYIDMIAKHKLLPLPADTPHYILKDDGIFPNSVLPAVIYKKVFELPDNHSAGTIEQVFEGNTWSNSWRNGIYDVHHYHSTTHEVLAVYSGTCKVMLGGDKGVQLTFEKGDVLIIPAGVAHKNMGQSDDFKCVGAYPDGKDFDLNYGKPGERPGTDNNIAKVALPDTDPVYGETGILLTYWGNKKV
jgi:uncharacterized protein YjlB